MAALDNQLSRNSDMTPNTTQGTQDQQQVEEKELSSETVVDESMRSCKQFLTMFRRLRQVVTGTDEKQPRTPSSSQV